MMQNASIGSRVAPSLIGFGEKIVDTIFRRAPLIVVILMMLPIVGAIAELLMRIADMNSGANFVRSVFSLGCHQIPERCPMIQSLSIILCYRCFGFYSGVVLGALSSRISRIHCVGRHFALILILPWLINLLDITSANLGFWDSSGLIRFFLGALIGMGTGCLAMMAASSVSRKYKNGASRVELNFDGGSGER